MIRKTASRAFSVIFFAWILGPRPGPWTAEPNFCVGADRSPVFVS